MIKVMQIFKVKSVKLYSINIFYCMLILIPLSITGHKENISSLFWKYFCTEACLAVGHKGHMTIKKFKIICSAPY
jgi:hypothetical protein